MTRTPQLDTAPPEAARAGGRFYPAERRSATNPEPGEVRYTNDGYAIHVTDFYPATDTCESGLLGTYADTNVVLNIRPGDLLTGVEYSQLALARRAWWQTRLKELKQEIEQVRDICTELTEQAKEVLHND